MHDLNQNDAPKLKMMTSEVLLIDLKQENEETESLVSVSESEMLEQAPKVESLQEYEIVDLDEKDKPK